MAEDRDHTEQAPMAGSPVLKAILEILRSDLYIQKKGFNQGQRYSYAREADFLDAVRPMLASRGVVLIPSYEVHSVVEGRTKDGSPTIHTTLVGTFTFLHAETGDAFPVRIIGQGTDPQDKGAYKAMTGALKYALRQTFLIETGDDPERDDDPAPARTGPAQPTASTPAEPGARPAAPPQNPSPAPPAASGGGHAHPGFLTVLAVDATPTRTGGTRYSAQFSNGVRAATFDDKDGQRLMEALDQNLGVTITTTKNGQYTNITSVTVAGGLPPTHER